MNNTQTPNFIKRPARSFNVDNALANRISDILNKIKGRVDNELAQSGKLDINNFIQYRINKKHNIIPNMNIFNQNIESRGLDVYFVVDCSYSMDYAGSKVSDLSATIFKALEKCPFINFKTIAYSSDGYSCYIDEINDLSECGRIRADDENRMTPTPEALDYVSEKIKKLENKKLIILLTDGSPFTKNYGALKAMDLLNESVVKMKNKKISFFTIFFENRQYNDHTGDNVCSLSETIAQMRKIFRGQLYQSNDFEDISKMMIKQLSHAIEKINQV